MKKIALFGYSTMSLEVMGRLNPSQYELIFAGKNEAEAERVAEAGFNSAVVDFRNDDALKALGIGVDIDILFCFYPKDSDNVFLTISARAMAKDLTIIAIVDEPESAEKLLAAGANKIIDPYEISGRKTYEMLVKPDITNIMDSTVFGRHDLNMAELEILPGSCFENALLGELKQRQHNVIIIGVVDKAQGDKLLFAVGEQDYQLDAGDVLVVLGPAQEISAFKALAECANKREVHDRP